MSSELFWAQAVITLVRARADDARRRGRSEIGASAVEWAIISGVVVTLALLLSKVIYEVVTSRAGEIGDGAN